MQSEAEVKEFNKTLYECNKNKIQLIQFSEWQWKYQTDKIKSIINSALNKFEFGIQNIRTRAFC